ncbi:hypothetical protein ALP36_102347 [Pseudomonas syringae pv. coriandricola]|uniref:Uncharacterized protein n=1 Tax=Pseudomonas syringae pv. coriandricola TaxID=264453 RepID=A0A3M4TS48_9PSED|nr:hypothetical protein ALP87_102264 [Pseudomonas syringae pv. coriandricola]RMU12188.1 hypothetical protein ALP36_102347 [Pseudomonas syringae pv. coriandricola]
MGMLFVTLRVKFLLQRNAMPGPQSLHINESALLSRWY